MSAAVLAEGDVAIDERSFDGREFRDAEIFLAKQLVDGAGSHGGLEHALGVHPAVSLKRAANYLEISKETVARELFG